MRRRTFVKLGAWAAVGGLWPWRAGAEVGPEENAALARRVADKILAETNWKLKDRKTGVLIDSSDGLAPNPDVVIASRFNDWYYPSLLVAEGLARLGAVLDVPAYRAFAPKTLAFTADHAAWFRAQWKAEKKSPTGWARLGHYLNVGPLWATGLAPLWIAHYHAAKDERFRDFTDRFMKRVDTAARSAEGLLLDGRNVRTDDAYLMAPGMLRHGLGLGDAKRIDDAVTQTIGFHRTLFDRERGLCRQSWNADTKQFSGDFWGRGGGWMALAHVDLLANLPPEHPRREEALACYREQMAGLVRWQAPEGGWRQLMDADEAWVETSCTGMFTYALARGVNEGWLDTSAAATARKGWGALTKRVRADGMLFDICPATSQGDRAHYLQRPRAVDDVHGYGPCLLAASEILRLSREPS